MNFDKNDSLINNLMTLMEEQLRLNGINEYKIADGNFHFLNADDKPKANAIIRDYLTYVFDKDAKNLM
ncbi:hypothetical protein [Sporomusa aerivorans]|uniref:hypothetical protein n=1 Tax=Sporomusa aerivorans TaxID=204936 RepID=UPI00352B421D